MKTKTLYPILLTLTCALTCTPIVHALDASQTLSGGAASIVLSPLVSLQGEPLAASAFFVNGIAFVVIGLGEAVGETISVIVQNTVDGSKAVVQVSSSAMRDLGVSVGTAVKVVAESAGYTLIAAGKILAFVPNEIGRELLHQSRLSK